MGGARSQHSRYIAVEGVIGVASPQARYRDTASDSSIRAPGQNVLSASPGAAYDFYSGSSLSAAHVSGLIALLREREPEISAAEVLSILRSSSPGPRGAGSGVDACRAVGELVGVGECS